MQTAGACGFSIFQGFTTSWSETLTHLSQCKLKQAGNKYFGLVRPKVLALVVVLALTCKFGQPRFFRTSPVRSIKYIYIYKQSWFREAQESFHFLFGLLDSLCRHKVATQCPNQQLKRVPDICRWASRVHRKSMFCCCIVGFFRLPSWNFQDLNITESCAVPACRTVR